ncbi:3-oxoacid CoA-transferase subunit B [Rhodovulum sp. DZ06]|uniref:3-oxoacid CoA-transferase subunit B n=1 Tax=Rhodovulum sp. DZ06 TaxID=3425126 RepID=UPI003D32EB5E
MTLTREQVGWRAAQDIQNGWHVNLGIGMPELCANAIPAGREIVFHSENGILGMGPSPAAEDVDPNLINAGKRPVTMLPGASIFDHALSFGIVRGRHLDLCVLGAYQLAPNGDIANWARSSADLLPAIGGAMDLAAGARRIWAVLTHVGKNGEKRLMETCSYPLTGAGVVSRIFTDLAVIDIDGGFLVREIAPGITRDELQDKTDAPLRFAEDCREIAAPVLEAAPEKLQASS